MQRSIGITLTALASVLGSVLAFLFGVVFLRTLSTPVQPPPGVSMALIRIGQIGAITMFALMGVWAAITAVGLWKLKGWARWSVLVYAGLLIFVSLPATFAMLFIPFPPTPDVSAEFMDRIRWSIVALYGVLTLFGGWLLYYFNRASIRVAFNGTALDRDSRRPMSITLIGAYLVLGGISCCIFVFLPFPAAVLGMMLNGIPARLFYLAFAIAYIWIGVGLLRLWPASRIAAMALLAFAVVNSAIFLIMPNRDERVATLTNQFSNSLPVNTPFASMPFTIGSLIFTAAITAVVMWFLVRNRPAFETQPGIAPSA